MNKFQDFKLVYRQGGRRLERVFKDTLYANVKRVADSFPPTVLWRIQASVKLGTLKLGFGRDLSITHAGTLPRTG
jgi:hypothetical protein